MPDAVRILAFAGSTREGSWNKKFVRRAAQVARDAGANVTLLDLADYRMPLFDADEERDGGIPENAMRFRRELEGHAGFLLSCPEYNSSITGVLKNSFDWASRPVPGEAPLASFRGKVVALLAASPGVLGGLRGLVVVRMMLGNIGAIVLPDQMALPEANKAFAEDGTLVDPKRHEQLTKVVHAQVSFLQRLG